MGDLVGKKAEILYNRLFAACRRLPGMGGGLWGRGKERIDAKLGIVTYLSRFEPGDMVLSEHPACEVTITPTQE